MNYTLMFEAKRGGVDGDIAIDDVRVTDGECPQKDRECDFQATNCHMNQVSTSNLSHVTLSSLVA